MDIASLIGLILCGILIVFAIVFDEDAGALIFSNLNTFINMPSILITFGGSFMCVLASGPLKDFINGLKSFTLILKVPKADEGAIIRQIIDLSNIARKEGLLALEETANSLEDEFMKKGILLIVDGTDPELVRNILETELINIDSRHKRLIAFWKNLGAMGPAWGMIGTLVGLINMLKNLSDPDSIGPNMAVALITTLYGSLLATKLSTNNDIEIMMKEVMIEGLLSIQAGENPRVIEEKLKSFLSPATRAKMAEGAGEA